ncbi:MAG: hypothetical protein VX964_06265 [Verrucomicrobiota bacterium]|nr:hypothetical protein [Verrucomicrobiota bacterium]
MTRELVFHIGTAKTGTTSIQHTLASNREVLAKNGVLYPELDLFPHNHRATTYFFKKGYTKDRQLAAMVPPGVQGDAFSAGQIDKVVEQASVSTASIIVLSNEVLNLPLDEYFASKLIEVMERTGCKILKPVVYVRSSASWFISMVQQFLKNGRVISDSIPTINRAKTLIRTLNSFSKLLNVELSVRSFERSKLLNGDVVVDFMDVIGKSDLTLKKNRKNFNTSISSEAMIYLEEDNQGVPRNQEELALKKAKLNALRQYQRRNKNYTKPTPLDFVAQYIWHEDKSLITLRDTFGIEFSDVDYSFASDVLNLRKPDFNSLRYFCNYKEEYYEGLRTHMDQIFG